MRTIYFLFFQFILIIAYSKVGRLDFQENKGQWPKQVSYGTFVGASKIFIESSSFFYSICKEEDLQKQHKAHINTNESKLLDTIKKHNYKVHFLNANFSSIQAHNKQMYFSNYFLGNDKTKWASQVASFTELELKNVYAKMDMKVYSEETNFKYDFILNQGANLSDIAMEYQYIDGLELRDGQLYLSTSVREVIEQKPVAYQIIKGKRIEVNCCYVKLDKYKIGFSLPNGYDKRYPLIIDPVVVVCSYSGASSWCNGSTATYDESGKIYTGGHATDANYPTSLGAYQTLSAGEGDILLEAYNSTGSTKLFATYLGGSSSDNVLDISVKNNEITLAGIGNSTNFPVSETAADTSFNGFQDFVIAKLNIDGSQLMAATYVGGTNSEGAFGVSYLPDEFWRYMEMAVDDLGHVTIFSNTLSSDFPVTVNAYSTTKQGGSEACVFRLNADLSQLQWSTYLGGSRSESAKAIRLDKTGGVYCFGMTDSQDFPVTSNAYATTKQGNLNSIDMFVTHLNSSGSALLASTYLGTTANDFASLIELDRNGDVYLCGNLDNGAAFVSTPGKYSDVGGKCYLQNECSVK